MTTQAPAMTNPYVGPRTFTYAQRHLFFGRESEARDLLARMLSERLLLFYAQSGAGKSSLLHTRLIPQLQEEKGFVVLPVARVSGELLAGLEQVDNIYAFNLMLSIDEGEDPARLAQIPLTDFFARLTQRTLVDQTGATHRGWIYDATQLPVPAIVSPSTRRYALIVDQFEEIITAFPERWRERAAFFRQIDQAIRSDPNLWVVFTLREDYVASLDPYAPLMEDRLRARYYMQRLGVAAALAAIQRPAAEIGGRPFEPGVAETLVDNLRRIKTSDQGPDALGQYIEPVQLQVVCYQLWKNLFGSEQAQSPQPERPTINLADLQRGGDVDTALADFYEDAIKAVLALETSTLTERTLRTWFDKYLITEEGTRGTVYQGEETTAGLPNAAVAVLQERFLLRTDLRAGGAWVELVHDRFIKPIQDANLAWKSTYHNPVAAAYTRWQADKQPNQLLRGNDLTIADEYASQNPNEITPEEAQYLVDSHRQWKIEQETMRRAAVIRRLLLASGAVVMVLLIAFTLYAFRQASISKLQAKIAKSRQLAAQSVAQSASELNNKNFVRSLLLALAAGAESDNVEAFSAIRTAIADPAGTVERTWAHGSVINEIAWDGKQHVVSVGQDRQIKLWDITQEKVQATWSVAETIGAANSAAWDATGTQIATGHTSGQVLIWSIDSHPIMTIAAHTGAVTSVDWTPQGNLLLTGGQDQMVRIWNPTTGERIHEKLLTAEPTRVRWDATGTKVLVAGKDGSISAWDVTQDKFLFTQNAYSYILGTTDVQWNKSATQILSAGVLGLADSGLLTAAHLWLFDTKLPFLTFGGQADVIYQAALSPAETVVATADETGEIRIWNAQSGLLVKVLRGHEGAIYSLRWVDENHLLSAGSDGKILLWNFAQLSELPSRTEYQARVRVLYWLDDATILSAADDGLGHIWRADSGEILMTLQHHGPISQARTNREGTHLLTSSDDGTIGVWDLQTHQEITRLGELNKGRYLYARWNQPDETLIMAGYECLKATTQACPTDLDEIHIWRADNVRQGQSPPPDLILTGHQGTIETARWNLTDFVAKREARMVTASHDGTIRLWDVDLNSQTAGQVLQTLAPATPISPTTTTSDATTRWVMEATWNTDGSALLSYGHDGMARIWRWDQQTGRFGDPLTLLHNGAVTWADWFQDDRQIVTVSEDGIGRIWEAKSGKLIHELRGHHGPIRGAVWNSIKKLRLLTVSDDGTAMWWNMQQGTWLRTFAGHSDKVSGALVDEAQDLLLTYGADNTARLWRLSTGDTLVILADHNAAVMLAAWNPSRTRITTGGSDGIVRQYYRTMDDLLRKVCTMPLITSLTEEERRALWNNDVAPLPCTEASTK